MEGVTYRRRIKEEDTTEENSRKEEKMIRKTETTEAACRKTGGKQSARLQLEDGRSRKGDRGTLINRRGGEMGMMTFEWVRFEGVFRVEGVGVKFLRLTVEH